MNFVVNASPPKPLDVATSNFAGAKVTRCKGYSGNILCDLNPKIKFKLGS